MKDYVLVFWDKNEGEESSFAVRVEATNKREAEKEGRRKAERNGWRYIETRLPSE